MSTERRLIEALSEFDAVEPSPDLFRRVERSVADDIERRRRLARWAAAIVAGSSIAVLGVASVTSRTASGLLVAPQWAIEAVETAALVAVVAVFGPMIRRFGAIFVEEIFDDASDVRRGFLRLIDVAYYLVFIGYILMTAQAGGLGRRPLITVALADTLPRIAGVLLLIGVIHAVTLSILPLIGLIHASTMRAVSRAGADRAVPQSPAAIRAERIVQIVLWAAAALAVTGLLVLVALVSIGGVAD